MLLCPNKIVSLFKSLTKRLNNRQLPKSGSEILSETPKT